MKHVLIFPFLFLLSLAAMSQPVTVEIADLIMAKDKLYIKNVEIDSISSDSTFSAAAANKIATTAAIKDYVLNNSGAAIGIGVGDAVRLTGLSITDSDATLTSATPQFVAGDVGKLVVVYRAAAGTDGGIGDELITTIASFTSTTSVELSVVADTTVVAVEGIMGTDNSPIFQAAFADNTVLYPPIVSVTGRFLFGSNVNLDTIINTGLIGNGDTLWYVSANPNSYIGGSEPERNLFNLLGCDNSIWENFVAENIGQTFARWDTLTTEAGWYDTLNNVAVTYNRHYNKQANSGHVIKFQNSRNVNIKNVTAINCGGLQDITSGGTPELSTHLRIEDCKVYGFGQVAMYPSFYAVFNKNYISNENAPVLNSIDQDNDLGTSHAMYAAGGFGTFKFINNDIRFNRGTAIQLNTGGGGFQGGTVISGNYLYECARAGTIIGNWTPFQVNLVGNTYVKSGRWKINSNTANVNFVGENWDSTYTGNTDWAGAYNIVAAQSVSISDGKYYQVTIPGDNAVISASGAAIQTNYKLVIDNCYFDSLNGRSFHFLADHEKFTGKVTIKNSEIYAPIYLHGGSGSPTTADTLGIDKFFITNNNFHVVGDDAIVVRFGATITGNKFYNTSTDYSISINLLTGSGYVDVMHNGFFNRGGANVLELTTGTTANDSIRFDQNSTYGTTTFSLNGHEFKQDFNNSIDGNWCHNVLSTTNEAEIFGTGNFKVSSPANAGIIIERGNNTVYSAMVRFSSSGDKWWMGLSDSGDFASSTGEQFMIGPNNTLPKILMNHDNFFVGIGDFSSTLAAYQLEVNGTFGVSGVATFSNYDSGYSLDGVPTNVSWNDASGNKQLSSIYSLSVALSNVASYAKMSFADSSRIVVLTGGSTYDWITNSGNDLFTHTAAAGDFTAAGDSITINCTCTVSIDLDFGYSGANNSQYKIKLLVDGTEDIQAGSNRTMTTTGIGASGFHTTIAATSGQVLKLGILEVAGTSDATFYNASFIVTKF